MITGTALAFFVAKIVGLGTGVLGLSSLISAFHQYSFKLDKKGVKTIDTESIREKARHLG
jgi:hypothetical protein